MDCKAFRKNHLAFVDDTLPGVEVVRMHAHLRVCAACAALDLRVRRSLMVVRSHLSNIEPSVDFGSRLSARLELERASQRAGLPRAPSFQWGGLAVMGTVLGIVVIVVLAAGVATEAPQVGTRRVVEGAPLSHDFAQPISLPNATPAFMASVSTGMAILPALMLAEEVPVRRVSQAESEPAFRGAGTIVPEQEQR